MTTMVIPVHYRVPIQRDRWHCVRCGRDVAGIVGYGWDVIRRQPAGRHGTMMPHLDLPSNLITVCGTGTYGCAGRIRRRETTALSLTYGFVVARDAWPAAVPIVIGGEPVWLCDDGTISDAAPGPVEVEAAP